MLAQVTDTCYNNEEPLVPRALGKMKADMIEIDRTF